MKGMVAALPLPAMASRTSLEVWLKSSFRAFGEEVLWQANVRAWQCASVQQLKTSDHLSLMEKTSR